jgi:hypothetical protein
LDEPDVLDNAFELIFAFDEIVALGYRENVNLAQIRTFTEMDSHEEKVYEAMRRVSTISLSPSLSPPSSLSLSSSLLHPSFSFLCPLSPLLLSLLFSSSSVCLYSRQFTFH